MVRETGLLIVACTACHTLLDLAAHVGKNLMAFAMIMLVFGVAVGAEQVASSPNLQCPSCRGKDYAPTPGQFNFFFLVRYA